MLISAILLFLGVPLWMVAGMAILVFWNLRRVKGAVDRFLHLNTQTASETHRQCRHLRIETEPDQPVWTDGEYTGRTPVEVSVVPEALTIAVA